MSLNGLLVYAAEDIPRNTWFIGELTRCAESEGCTLRLCTVHEGFPSGFAPDFVINRSRCAEISRECEEMRGISVYNSAAVTRITNDKYLTDRFLRAHGIPTAQTCRISPGDPLPQTAFPVVVKPTDGHGGQGVQLVHSLPELEAAARRFQKPFLVQEPMVFGWDMRVYVLGGEIYAAMLRTSESDFRSNFSLGGQAACVQPAPETVSLVQRVQAVLPMTFAGVDILRHPDGHCVIGEIEDAVGCRMLYALTDKNPAQDLIRTILRQETANRKDV
jgi:RimK family alpha-L-glutamate ligase